MRASAAVGWWIMASCLAARTAKSRSNEPPPCFAWGDPLSAIAPSRTLHP